jgi:hypothetical protein
MNFAKCPVENLLLYEASKKKTWHLFPEAGPFQSLFAHKTFLCEKATSHHQKINFID